MSKSDRVTFSYGMTVPGVTAFESTKFTVGYESDLEPGEDAEEAMERVGELVMNKVTEEFEKLLMEQAAQNESN
jgi:hypothetical protein